MEEPIKPIDNRQPNGKFGPGNIANPNGRPKKGQALTDIMREMFTENGQIPKAIVAKLLQMAAGGDIAAIREVLDRIEGKPLQATDITTLGEKLEAPHITIDTHASPGKE